MSLVDKRDSIPEREPRQPEPPAPPQPDNPDGRVSTNPPDGEVPIPLPVPGNPPGRTVPPPVTPPAPLPDAKTGGNQDATTLPSDIIGDIPPPPVPPPPPPISGTGVAGIPGTEGSTFARPGSHAAVPFRTPAFFSQHPQRFGPGVPTLGGGSADVAGLGEDGLGISPDEAADLLRQLAMGSGG